MIYVLRLVHILGGVFWVGSVMFATLLLAPTLQAVGPGAGPVMNQLVKVRKMPLIMMISSMVTIVAGVWLLIIDSAGQPGVWMRSGTGMTFGIGGAPCLVLLPPRAAVRQRPRSKRRSGGCRGACRLRAKS
jgi:uncharacterized membrane protein